ncbi:MAG: hypothetical protein COA32_09465 [Fluviicola sp.]|nr:MAG: hypothetical protein COA32_09465 [Fluviicola sp.]
MVSIFSVRIFQFYPSYFNRLYPFRFSLIKRNARFDYSELYAVEVRNRKGSYQRPYVLFHFNKDKINSKFFGHRSFMYENIDDLTPLIKCLVEHKVKIKLNITKEYKDDYREVVGLIENNQYKS